MLKYTATSQAPKLTATAVALKVNGITAASDEAAKLAAVNMMMEDIGQYSNIQLNHFITALTEKVLISAIFRRVEFKSKLVQHFLSEGTTISAAKEVFDSKLLDLHDFDPAKRYPANQEKSKTLVTVLHTVAKKYITNTVSYAGLRAAFASEQAYGQWAAKQVELLSASMNLHMFRIMQEEIKNSVKNELTLDATKFDTWDKIFIELTRIANSMQLPTTAYNIGYTPAEIADIANADKLRVNVNQINDLLIMASPDFENAIKGKVSPIKYHNEYFDAKKFKGVIPLELPNSELYMVADNAFEGYYRINEVATQNWAANLTLEYFLHFWFVFGMIPWANGLHIKFTEPVDKPAANPTK